ncbi:unnamed protein product [Penicillium pancosmium]
MSRHSLLSQSLIFCIQKLLTLESTGVHHATRWYSLFEAQSNSSVVDAIFCKINPDRSRSEQQQADLRKFSKSIQDFGELPSFIEEATVAMGLDEHNAFSKDVLSIEICLTLVDLPGLIHSANKNQSENDIELTKSLVQQYTSEARTIVLAVISAKNDFANQIIFEKLPRI